MEWNIADVKPPTLRVVLIGVMHGLDARRLCARRIVDGAGGIARRRCRRKASSTRVRVVRGKCTGRPLRGRRVGARRLVHRLLPWACGGSRARSVGGVPFPFSFSVVVAVVVAVAVAVAVVVAAAVTVSVSVSVLVSFAMTVSVAVTVSVALALGGSMSLPVAIEL